MRIIICAAFVAALAAGLPGAAVAANGLVTERIVILMRHGIRPPLESPPVPDALAPDAWPAWPVPDGNLTPRGAAAITLLGRYERQFFADAGLLPRNGCLSARTVSVYADTDERTVATAAALGQGLSPGCAPAVGHAAHTPDPLFASKGPWAGFDAIAAREAMLRAAGGSADAPVARDPALFIAMQTVLTSANHAFLDLPARITLRGAGQLPDLRGPLPVARSAAIAFSMEYAEGMPMEQVAWGRADKALVLQFLAFHAQEFAITLRPLPIARFAGGPLARRILAGLTGAEGPPLTILVGHDTNIAAVAGLFDLHWQLADYPPDEPAPGGGLVFALLRDPVSGARYVTVAYMAQTLNQMRTLSPLTLFAPPPARRIAMPGCGQSAEARACPLEDFIALVPAVP